MYDDGGYIFFFDDDPRSERLHERVRENLPFSSVVHAEESKLRGIDLAFLSFSDNEVQYAALVRGSGVAATGQVRVAFSRFLDVYALDFERIEGLLPANLRQYAYRSSGGTARRIPPGTWKQVIAAIKGSTPDDGAELDSLEALRLRAKHKQTGPEQEIVAQEKDAVGLAMEIFFGDDQRGLSENRRSLLPSLSISQGMGLAPFLVNSHAVLSEDAMIANDHGIFGDWSIVGRSQIGAVTYEKGKERLTIVNVNRRGVEHTLGVDLLYYNHHFNSYVMVQYKRMVKENHQTVYRLDRSYREEIQRMREFQRLFDNLTTTKDMSQYRLHPQAFYFKLCPSVTFEPLSPDLIKGMYLPLDYWEVLLRSDSTLGPRGAIAVTYDNVGRYINNTLFVDLVQSGWVGSRTPTSDAITNIVTQSLADNKSVILAASSLTTTR